MTYNPGMGTPYEVSKGRNASAITARREWMVKRKITVRTIADATGIDWGTCARWITFGRTPRSLYRKVLLKHFPDFPI